METYKRAYIITPIPVDRISPYSNIHIRLLNEIKMNAHTRHHQYKKKLT